MGLEHQEQYQSQAEIQERSEEDSIILTLAPHLEIEDVTSSSLVRSDSGQFFLITYDASEKVISKHEINIHVSADDFLGIKCNNSSLEQFNGTSMLEGDSDNFAISSFSDIPNTEVEKSQTEAEDALQLAMQEIENESSDLLEPVSYEVKLAALNAMIPSGDTSNGKTKYNCAICSKSFDRKYEFKSHLSKHFGLNVFLCPVCGKQFTHSSNLSRHLRIHSGLKPYKCKDCGKRFNQANSLQTHKEYIHGDSNKRHCCPLCGRLYKTLQLLRRHCKINHRDEAVKLNPSNQGRMRRQFHCSECGESCITKSLLLKHKADQHANLLPDVAQLVNEEIIPPALTAEKMTNDIQLNFETIESIDSMLREIEDETTNVTTSSVFAPQIFCDNVLLTINEVVEKVAKNVCLECGKQFNRYMSYKQHWGVHETSLRKFECDKCGMVFAWKSTFVKHQTQFHSDAPAETFSCDEPGCCKTYKSVTQLQVHKKRDHQMIRRFSCEECGKQFYKAHDLSVHKRTHSKEKPYMCGTCGKAFSHISHVIRHEKSHRNIRPYTCSICLKSFTQASVLKTHSTKCSPTLSRSGVSINKEGITQ